MKRKLQFGISIVILVLGVIAEIHFGSTIAEAYRQEGAAPDNELVVDRDSGRLGSPCTSVDPCARITDALAIARAKRYGFDPAIPMLNPHRRIRIIVRASSKPYTGSSDTLKLKADPFLESWPLFINISDLDLIGESRFNKDADGWIEENSVVSNATVIKSVEALPGNLALILIGVSAGMTADDVSVEGFVLDGNTPAPSSGFLIVVDRGQSFAISDTYLINATYGVATQGATGVVERCLMTNMGEGVLVFGGNSTNWPSEVTVRNTRSVDNAFGGLVFFGSAFSPNAAFPPLADFGAYNGVFQPVPFTGTLDRTVGHVVHNDLSRNAAIPNTTSGLRMALIAPNLPAGQAAGHLVMTVNDNRLNDNAHAFVIDAGFSFRSKPTDFTGSFTGKFDNNQASGSHTARALITFNRNNAAETPSLLPVWKYLVNSRYQVMYSNGEFDETAGPGGRVWIDNPAVDPISGRILNNELILQPAID